jgi:Tol biopolymer transport system component
MKKLLLGSAALLMFSLAIMIFQISCKKDAFAQRPTSTTGKILLLKSALGSYNGPFETWIADADGSNQVQIIVNTPGWRLDPAKLSTDGTKIFFLGRDSATMSTSQRTEVFSTDIDGSNLHQVTNESTTAKWVGLVDVN